jgi:hypothetical protein
MYNYLFER